MAAPAPMHGQADEGENVMEKAFEAVLMDRDQKEKGWSWK